MRTILIGIVTRVCDVASCSLLNIWEPCICSIDSLKLYRFIYNSIVTTMLKIKTYNYTNFWILEKIIQLLFITSLLHIYVLLSCLWLLNNYAVLHVRSVYLKLSSFHLSIMNSYTFVFAFDIDSKIISLNVLCVV